MAALTEIIKRKKNRNYYGISLYSKQQFQVCWARKIKLLI